MISVNLENLPTLRTSRLLLRPMSEADTDLVVRWRNAEHIAKMSRETTQGSLTERQHLEWFRRSRNLRVDYVIIRKEMEQPIGSVSFTYLVLHDFSNCGELGKYIGEASALGQGFASEATREWLKFGFEKLNFDCIVSRTRAINRANIRLNEKLGFQIQPFPNELKPVESGWLFMQIYPHQSNNK